MSSASPPDSSLGAAPKGSGLTRREREILRLMAQDLTNGEIAERLVVSPGTVKWYVKEIYRKLGVHSRDEAIAALGTQTAPADAPAEGRGRRPSRTTCRRWSRHWSDGRMNCARSGSSFKATPCGCSRSSARPASAKLA
ncbi:MAG: helix-turn-helix transcriptional regulator [Chloroflexi bacterium]|nr:helix-turn-helix transcriptional regulator [Chloroflexota bacterium]